MEIMRFSLEDILFMVAPPTTAFLISSIINIKEYISNRTTPPGRETTGKLIQIKSEIKSMSDSLDSPWWVIKSDFVYEYPVKNKIYRETLDSIISLGQTEPLTEEQAKAVNQSLEESCPSWRKEIRFWYDPSFPTKLTAYSNPNTIPDANSEFFHMTFINIYYSVILAVFFILMVISDKLGCQGG